MHRLFSDRYSDLHPDPSPEVLERRWSAIVSVCERLESRDLIEITKFINHLPDTSRTDLEGLVDRIKEEDSTFPVRDNDELLRLMFEFMILELTNSSELESEALIVSMAITTGCCMSLNRKVWPDVLQGAEDFLSRLSVVSRELDELSPPPELTSDKSEVKLFSTPNSNAAYSVQFSNNDALLLGLIEKLEADVSSLHSTLAQVVNTSETAVETLKEETEILWWLFGEVSTECNVNFSKLPASSAPVVVAKELAERTIIIPGPPSAGAFLSKALAPNADTELMLSSIVEVDRGFLGKLPIAENLGSLTPLLLALSKYSEHPSGKGWEGPFENLGGLKPSSTLPARLWATQLYNELLLVRLLDA